MDLVTVGVAASLVIVSALYASVGHGGASGYLAVLALFALPAAELRPAVLVLNVVVSSIALTAFVRQGKFSWATLWPFALSAVPLAYLGGRLTVPDSVYRPLLAVVLTWSALYLLSPRREPNDDPTLRPPVPAALASGGVMGFLSGLTGIGGGVFLSPVLLVMKWAPTQTASGVAAGFILLNSLAGLAGRAPDPTTLPWAQLAWWIPAVLLGAYAGSRFGARTTDTRLIYRLLGVVLLIAVLKLVIPS